MWGCRTLVFIIGFRRVISLCRLVYRRSIINLSVHGYSMVFIAARGVSRRSSLRSVMQCLHDSVSEFRLCCILLFDNV